ncbi:MAG: sirohydrochlorin cobaltochelatase [Breznakibacter sp.]
MAAQKVPKTGILLVAFGTSVPDAQRAYRQIEQRVQAAFPDTGIRWGFTSSMVRHKLEQSGQTAYSPASALARMADEGFTHVAVQSLHVIPGYEYHDLLRVVHSMQGLPKGIQRITVGDPLLTSHDDMASVTGILANWVQTFRHPGDAVVFMGHGTNHPSNIYYPGLQFYLGERDPMLFVGTVEGYPSVDDVVKKLKTRLPQKVWLVPLMTVAGDHALNDMTGNNGQSWEEIMQREQIPAQAVLKGLGQIDEITDVWIAHLRTALGQLADNR